MRFEIWSRIQQKPFRSNMSSNRNCECKDGSEGTHIVEMQKIHNTESHDILNYRKKKLIFPINAQIMFIGRKMLSILLLAVAWQNVRSQYWLLHGRMLTANISCCMSECSPPILDIACQNVGHQCWLLYSRKLQPILSFAQQNVCS